jgi:hypothetical protein
MKSIGCTIILHGAGGIGKKCYRSVFRRGCGFLVLNAFPFNFGGRSAAQGTLV